MIDEDIEIATKRLDVKLDRLMWKLVGCVVAIVILAVAADKLW